VTVYLTPSHNIDDVRTVSPYFYPTFKIPRGKFVGSVKGASTLVFRGGDQMEEMGGEEGERDPHFFRLSF
jgi:hypothetical protein